MGTNKAEEIKSVLTNDFGYDFESEFFTDEIKTLVDEVIEVTNNSSQSEIDELKSKVDIYESILNTRLSKIQELTKEVERLRNAMQLFCDRVDKGEVRSTKTYNQFKELLTTH